MATTIGSVTYNVAFNGRALPAQARALGHAIGQSLNEGAQRANPLSRLFSSFRDRMRELNKESNAFHSRWKQLPHGFRQFAFYAALFASLGSQISILGSAAGSGLTVLSVAALAGAVGMTALLVGLKGVTGELSLIAPLAQPAIQAFRDLGDDFAALQQAVQGRLFEGLAPLINNLATGLIPILQSGLVGVAGVLNGLFARILEGVGGGGGLARLDALLVGLAPIIQALGNATISFVAALGQIAVVSLPFVQNFADKLNELAITFFNWTNSVEGNAALTEWFENGATAMNAILPLLAATGAALNSLVNPTTMALFEQTLGYLTEFMPALGSLLNVIALLDPIGLIAQVLRDLGVALQPALPAFTELALIINGALSSGIAALAPMIGQIVTEFAPLLVTIAQFASSILGALIPALQPLINAFTFSAPLINQFVMALVNGLLPVLDQLGPILTPIASTFYTLIQSVLPPLIDIVTALAPVFVSLVAAIAPLLTAILPPLAEGIGELLTLLAPLIISFVELLPPILDLLKPLLELVGPILGPLIQLMVLLIKSAIQPLTFAIDNLLVPAFTFATDLVRNFMPVIAGVTETLGGLINFVIGVFTGDWKRAWEGIVAVFSGQWNSMVGIVKGVLNTVIGVVNNIIRQINSVAAAVGGALGFSISIPTLPRLAAGGIANVPMSALIGEAGPEAVVPLNRPLGLVDPRVRELSAIAQGKALPSTSTSGRSVTVAEGAIQIVGVRDGGQAATSALDRLAAMAGV